MINGRRIYGYLEYHAPVVVSWDIYRQHKNSLMAASYNKDILEELFPGGKFPNIEFTYYEIRHLDWEQLCALCQGFGFTTNRSNESRRRKLKIFIRENC